MVGHLFVAPLQHVRHDDALLRRRLQVYVVEPYAVPYDRATALQALQDAASDRGHGHEDDVGVPQVGDQLVFAVSLRGHKLAVQVAQRLPLLAQR